MEELASKVDIELDIQWADSRVERERERERERNKKREDTPLLS